MCVAPCKQLAIQQTLSASQIKYIGISQHCSANSSRFWHVFSDLVPSISYGLLLDIDLQQLRHCMRKNDSMTTSFRKFCAFVETSY